MYIASFVFYFVFLGLLYRSMSMYTYTQKMHMISLPAFYVFNCLGNCRHIVRMSATGKPAISLESMVIKPPSHPTYDLKGVIKLALAEDVANQGYISLMFFSLLYVLNISGFIYLLFIYFVFGNFEPESPELKCSSLFFSLRNIVFVKSSKCKKLCWLMGTYVLQL